MGIKNDNNLEQAFPEAPRREQIHITKGRR